MVSQIVQYSHAKSFTMREKRKAGMRQMNASRLPCRKHSSIITTVRIKYSLARVWPASTFDGGAKGWLITTASCRKMLYRKVTSSLLQFLIFARRV